ncbi:o-succinylbenzoate synthase [Algoriphagus namhaensis]|uniref:o-succinylbenzoate synthase n=1 Tax=Algoriphagus namhaensis TaxID=915353 RepID=A0ABV8AT83_9BACT
MSSSQRISFSFIKRTLNFTFDAGTSRGVLRQRDVYWIKAESECGTRVGWGEAAPLIHLSLDFLSDFQEVLDQVLNQSSNESWSLKPNEFLTQVRDLVPFHLPSIRFGLESALLDLHFGGVKKYFENGFYDSNESIPINGLIWMGEKEMMLRQIDQKLSEGFSCIKMKIGAIDFDQELELLGYIRQKFDKDEITLRVDANGAFSAKDAPHKLQQLADLDIHSIEQPIAAGQIREMKELCKITPLPIALDEELIGVEEKATLLDEIQPQHIILKPTLVGGILETQAWIEAAEERGIGWWMTSALESNIGLNVISQLASTYDPVIPQGLGTGKLYHNNLLSPLTIAEGKIKYNAQVEWESVS